MLLFSLTCFPIDKKISYSFAVEVNYVIRNNNDIAEFSKFYREKEIELAFITENADTLEVDPEGFSLWGGSAGARMAAALGNADNALAYGIPQASAVIMQYTGYSYASRSDAPTYVNVGTSDGIASWKTMQSRLKTLESYGIPTEFHSFEGLPHGFGLGTGTAAEGWINDAADFWESQL